MGSIEAADGEGSYVWRPDATLEGPSVEPDVDEDLSEEELVFASSRSDSTFDDVKSSLEDEGVSTERIAPSDVSEEDGDIYVNGVEASEFDGRIFYRPSTWFSDLSRDDQLEKMGLMSDLESQYDVDFFGGAQSALVSGDKKATKEAFSSKGVGTVEDYSVKEAFERVDSGEDVVVKPRKGTRHGDGVELAESSSELESYIEDVQESFDEGLEDVLLFEEYFETGENADNSDMRMVVVGDEVYRMERAGGDGIANNLGNNGKYVEPPEMSGEEEELANRTREIFGEGFYAVDYIRTEEGGVKVLENNSTPGTKIDDELEVDLMDRITTQMYSGKASGEAYGEPAIL